LVDVAGSQYHDNFAVLRLFDIVVDSHDEIRLCEIGAAEDDVVRNDIFNMLEVT
jgi:hypothetical protein